MRPIVVLGLVLSVGIALLVGGFLMLRQPPAGKTHGLLQLYWEANLSRTEQRHRWRAKLTADNIHEVGRLGSLFYVTWIGTALQCQHGFLAERAQFLEVSYLGSKEFLLAWEDREGTVCRVAVLSSSTAVSSPTVSAAKALLGVHRNAYPAFVQKGEVISLLDPTTWVRDGKLSLGCHLRPLGDASKFGRTGHWPGVYYIFDREGKVLEVGFFFS